MAMPEMQKAISKLRLLLATMKAKEEEMENLSRQFQRQLVRAPAHPIHGGHALDATLSIMEEIQERLDGVEKSRTHLAAIKRRAQDELQALELTGRIEQAKTELASLKAQRNSGERGEEVEEEKIEELQRFVQEASVRAGQNITGELEDSDLGEVLSRPATLRGGRGRGS